MMQKPGFKLYKKFNRRKGLPLSCYKKILRDCGLAIQMDELKQSMSRALRHGFAEKLARRYRMPWRLCDYHIARTLGVKGLTPPRFGSIAWKGSRITQLDIAKQACGETSADLNAQVPAVNNNKDKNEAADKSPIVKLEDRNEGERRSAHYLITDYWNNMEGFFGTLETEKPRANGDFTRPVVPMPQKVWQLKTEPVSQEPMWTYASPAPSVIVCKQESNSNNYFNGPPTSQNVTKT